MKQRLLSVLVLLVVVATLGFASNGDTINIGGYVTLKLDLTVLADAEADNLQLETTDALPVEVNPTIAQITISTNNTAGWELWVFAVNADGASTAMINADADEIPYTISYAGAAGVSEEDIPAVGLRVGERIDESTGEGPVALSITYDQRNDYPAGYYSDQLAIVLRAK